MAMGSTIKIFRVLEMLCKDGPAKASTISHELQLNKSSVHRFLNVLHDMGYVCQVEKTGLYAATLKMFEVGVPVKSRIGIARIAEPVMRQLQIKLNEVVNLGVLSEYEVTTLERVLPDDRNTNIVIKTRLPAYCTAFGKVLLAHLNDVQLEEYFKKTEFVAYTSRTVKNAEQLKLMLDHVKKDGFAIDDRELDNNIRSVASPIYNENGYVVAALSVTGSVSRLVGGHYEEIKSNLIVATYEISKLLGNQT